MKRTTKLIAGAVTVVAVGAAGVVYAQMQSRTTWVIAVEDLGDNALLDRCIDRDLVEQGVAAPTDPPTMATVTLRAGTSRADAEAATRCLADAGATATVTAVDR